MINFYNIQTGKIQSRTEGRVPRVGESVIFKGDQAAYHVVAVTHEYRQAQDVVTPGDMTISIKPAHVKFNTEIDPAILVLDMGKSEAAQQAAKVYADALERGNLKEAEAVRARLIMARKKYKERD